MPAGTDVYLLLLFVYALAAAGLAFFFGDFALALTVAAHALHGNGAKEGVGGLVDLALPVAMRAGYKVGAHFGARALAGLARAGLGQEHRALGAKYGLLKGDLEVDRDIAAAALAYAAGLAGKKVAEYVAHVKPAGLALVKRLGKLREVKARTLSKPAKTRASAALGASSAKHAAVAVVLGALFVVGQDRVRLRYLLKFVGVALFFVGVELVRELVECLFNFVLRRLLLHPQYLVIVALVRHIDKPILLAFLLIRKLGAWYRFDFAHSRFIVPCSS